MLKSANKKVQLFTRLLICILSGVFVLPVLYFNRNAVPRAGMEDGIFHLSRQQLESAIWLVSDAAGRTSGPDLVRLKLEEESIPMADAEVTMIPQTYVTLSDAADIASIQKTLDMLDEDDDVQEVYTNWEE